MFLTSLPFLYSHLFDPSFSSFPSLFASHWEHNLLAEPQFRKESLVNSSTFKNLSAQVTNQRRACKLELLLSEHRHIRCFAFHDFHQGANSHGSLATWPSAAPLSLLFPFDTKVFDLGICFIILPAGPNTKHTSELWNKKDTNCNNRT